MAKAREEANSANHVNLRGEIDSKLHEIKRRRRKPRNSSSSAIGTARTAAKVRKVIHVTWAVVVADAGIVGASQGQDAAAHRFRQAAGTGAPATGVGHRRLASCLQPFLQASDVSHAQAEQFGGSATRQSPFYTTANHNHPLQFSLSQRECLLFHEVTLSRCR